MSENESISRRDFFRLGFRKSKETLKEATRTAIKMKFPRNAIRPPGALPEEQFLLACTRCGDCQTACPHNAIHMMDLVQGGAAGKTPFIDPENQPCLYCKDVPCVKVCEPRALLSNAEGVPYKIGIAEFNKEHCLVNQGQYCDYCFNSCPAEIKAISKNEDKTPLIDPEKCVGCGKCEYICVSQTGKAITVRPL